MSDIRVYASDHSLLTLALDRLIEDSETDREATLELCSAVDDLTADWLVPLGIAARLECCDPANFYESSPAVVPGVPHHFLRALELHPDLYVARTYTAAREEAVPSLDKATQRRWLAAALAQRCGSGREIALAELVWSIVRARLPLRPDVYYPGGEVTTLIEEHDNALWALGQLARSPVGPPARVQAVNTHGGLELRLSLFWDVWTVHPEGRAWIDLGVQRVLARGRGWEFRQVFPAA